MAVAIAADEQPSWPPRVLISVTGLTIGDSVDLYRVVAGEATAVRAGQFLQATDTSLLRIDAELPFGVPVAYRAVVNGTDYDTSATTYTLPGGKVALTDAVTGLAAEVVILTWPEKQRQRAASVFDVAGRNVVVSGAYPQFTAAIELFCESWSQTESVLALLAGATSGIVQIRQPGGYEGVDCYVHVSGHRERRWSQDGSDPRRVHALDVEEVSGWAPVLEASGYTLQDIADVYTGLTLDDLSDDFATLLAVAQGEFEA